jgi:hypothetical protein
VHAEPTYYDFDEHYLEVHDKFWDTGPAVELRRSRPGSSPQSSSTKPRGSADASRRHPM